jgi:hypothetical protein
MASDKSILNDNYDLSRQFSFFFFSFFSEQGNAEIAKMHGFTAVLWGDIQVTDMIACSLKVGGGREKGRRGRVNTWTLACTQRHCRKARL